MCATKLVSDHGHHNAIAVAFVCASRWHVESSGLRSGMSVPSVESEYVVGFTSRVSWNRKSRDDGRSSRHCVAFFQSCACRVER